MARKFKIGDKVKVVKDLSSKNFHEHGFKLGKIGKVIEIAINEKDCPYGVSFRNRCGTSFAAQELELIKGGK